MTIPLESHGEEYPSGENLEYDPLFTDMMLASQPGEERQMGDEVIAAEDPDYGQVIEKARAVLEKSHDLRAAVELGNAELRVNGLPGFAEVTAFIRGCLTDYWASCHPELDADDDNDPTMRVNAAKGLADTGATVRSFRFAPLTNSRQMGRFTLRDIEIAEGDIPVPDDMDNPPNTAAISAAFRDTDTAEMDALVAAAEAIVDDLGAIDAAFDENTPGQGPDLDPIIRVAKRVLVRIKSETGADVTEEEAVENGGGQESASGGAPAARGPISSQADVVRALDQIIEYFEKHEPSSPLPLLLSRARRLVGADFMAIVDELAPGGSSEVKSAGGIASDDY